LDTFLTVREQFYTPTQGRLNGDFLLRNHLFITLDTARFLPKRSRSGGYSPRVCGKWRNRWFPGKS